MPRRYESPRRGSALLAAKRRTPAWVRNCARAITRSMPRTSPPASGRSSSISRDLSRSGMSRSVAPPARWRAESCTPARERRRAPRGRRRPVTGPAAPGRCRAARRGSRPRTAQRARGPLAPTTRRSPRPAGRRGKGARTSEIVATRNSRRVEVATGRGIAEVTEVTRAECAHPSPGALRLSRPDPPRLNPPPPGERRRPGPSGLPVRAPGWIAGLEGQKPPEEPHHADLPGDGEQEDHRPPSRDGGCNIVAGQHEQGVRR